ncbi:MAG: carboxymuconolactone decarboxylase family protein [Hydrogenophaga sp.]|nr:carboxymuconolactone decarboxylase family protein [Hydrogenophaga sp.]
MVTSSPRKKTLRSATTSPALDPAWEACAWLDAPWADRLGALAREADEAPGLDPKLMALVALAVDAAPQSLYPQGMRRHMRRALIAGASLEEVAAVLRYVSVLGQHSLKLGAHILLEELATLRHRDPTSHQEATPT